MDCVIEGGMSHGCRGVVDGGGIMDVGVCGGCMGHHGCRMCGGWRGYHGCRVCGGWRPVTWM